MVGKWYFTASPRTTSGGLHFSPVHWIMNSVVGYRFFRMWTTAVLNAITNRANSASKNLSVRYSSIPNNDGGPSSASTSNLSKIMGGSGIILPLDVEETVTCFCRLVSTTKASVERNFHDFPSLMNVYNFERPKNRMEESGKRNGYSLITVSCCRCRGS